MYLHYIVTVSVITKQIIPTSYNIQAINSMAFILFMYIMHTI